MRKATNSRRGAPHSEPVIAVQEAIARRAAEVVTFKHIPGWLTTAMERSAAECPSGRIPSVVVAERPNGRNPARIYLVTDLLHEIECGTDAVSDLFAVLAPPLSNHDDGSVR